MLNAQVTATDEDDGINGQVRYSTVDHGGGDDSPLTIDASTGQLSLRRSLDYERDHTHVALVAAHDAGPASVTAYARVVVHVTDVNDHAPEFLLPAAANDTVSVADHFRRGDVITRLVATDADVGNNGRVAYQLVDVDRATDFYFRLDNVTGDIIARRDTMATGSYTLVVTAVDAGTPPRRVQSTLTIVVNISTSGEQRQRWSPVNHLTVVIVIVGTSLPVAILLLAAILVLLRSRSRGERAGVRSRDVDDGKCSPGGAATSELYATLSGGRGSSSRALTMTRARCTLTDTVTAPPINHSAQVHHPTVSHLISLSHLLTAGNAVEPHQSAKPKFHYASWFGAGSEHVRS